jgi:hypothetical protein
MYDSYADQAANLLGVKIPPENRNAVIQNIERTSRIAAALFNTPITDEAPAAPRFEP